MSLTLNYERSAETGRYNYLFHRLRRGFEALVTLDVALDEFKRGLDA
jgi:hypothetical protein